MALTQRLQMRQSQALVMTPQLMQAIKLLQLSNLDLAAYVEGELEKNPLLERAAEGEPGVVDATIEQIVFEGPTVRVKADAGGQSLELAVGGLERLTLIDGGKRDLRLRLREVSLVPANHA